MTRGERNIIQGYHFPFKIYLNFIPENNSPLLLTLCLAYAMADHTLDGIWGGLTRRERGQLRHTPSDPLEQLPATA